MLSIGKIICLLILSSLILLVSSKNYEFEVTYECVNNEYKWFEQKLKNETVYGCKNWVQKILIKQQKNEYVRFQSQLRQQQEQIEQDQQKDFEQQQKKQQAEQELLKQKQQEQILQQIEQLEKQKQEEKMKQVQNQYQNKQNIETSTKTNSQYQTNIYTKKSTSQKHAHKLSPINNRRLIQNQNEQLTHKLATIFHNLLPSNSRHKLKSSYDSQQHQNQIRHYFELRHTEEQKGQGKEKFKPIKVHRSHPVEDVMFLLELIQMNSLILQRTYPLHDQDIPSLQQLQKRHPKPELIEGSTQTQKTQKQHFSAFTAPQNLRHNN